MFLFGCYAFLLQDCLTEVSNISLDHFFFPFRCASSDLTLKSSLSVGDTSYSQLLTLENYYDDMV